MDSFHDFLYILNYIYINLLNELRLLKIVCSRTKIRISNSKSIDTKKTLNSNQFLKFQSLSNASIETQK